MPLDWVLALGCFAFFLTVYLVLAQPDVSWNGAALIYAARHGHPVSLPQHVAFIRLFWGWLVLGERAGLSLLQAGIVYSAFMFAAAAGLFFLLLRRFGVAAWGALLAAVLLGFNASALKNATTVELYGAAFMSVLLSFWVFTVELGRGNRWSCLLFPVTCAGVLVLHIGFAFWVLSMFLAVMIHERADRRRLVLRVTQGVAALVLVALAYWRTHHLNFATLNTYNLLFNTYHQHVSGWARLVRLVQAPACDFNAYAGLLLFPALYGWRIGRRRYPVLATQALLATVLFIGYYAFWTVDQGTFYLPLQLLWGFFAALGLGHAARDGNKGLSFALLGLMLFDALLIYPFQLQRIAGLSAGLVALLTAGFYALLATQWFLARPANRPTERGEERPEPAPGARRFIGAAWAVTLAINLTCFLPFALIRKAISHENVYLAALGRLAPVERPLGVRLITSINPPHRAFAEGLYDPISPAPGDWTVNGAIYDPETMALWLRDTARPEGPIPLWIDEASLAPFKADWPVHTPPDLTLDRLRFEPAEAEGFRFYRVRLDR